MKATKQYFPVVLFIMLDYAVQGGSNFWHCGWNPLARPFKWKLTEQYSPVVLLIMLY